MDPEPPVGIACPTCPRTFSSNSALNKHRAKGRCNGLLRLQCGKCRRVFPSKFAKYQHSLLPDCTNMNGVRRRPPLNPVDAAAPVNPSAAADAVAPEVAADPVISAVDPAVDPIAATDALIPEAAANVVTQEVAAAALNLSSAADAVAPEVAADPVIPAVAPDPAILVAAANLATPADVANPVTQAAAAAPPADPVKPDDPVDVEFIAGPSSAMNASLNNIDDIEHGVDSDCTLTDKLSRFSNEGYTINGVNIRRTKDTPPKVSVYDIMTAITDNDSKNASDNFSRLCERFPEVRASSANFKFPGQGQRPTPVTDARGFVMILNLLPGEKAAHFRMSSADIMVRYLGGDQSLIAEINRNAAAQEALPENNIGKLFGATVAASSTAIVPTNSALPRLELDSVTGFVDMRAPQHYFRGTPGSMWTNVHPLGRPDKLVSPETLMQLNIVKSGCQGESTGRQLTHDIVLKGSKLLDSLLTNSYSHVEQRAKDIWKNQGVLYEGTFAGKSSRDTELLLIRSQAEYVERVAQVQSLVIEAESSMELKIEIEKTKQKDADAKKAEADAEAKKAEADAEARKAEADARKAEAEAEARKCASHEAIELCRMNLQKQLIECAQSGMDKETFAKLADAILK